MPSLAANADLCVLGGGETGFLAATAGVALGLRVTLVASGAIEPFWRNWDIVLATLRAAGREAVRRDEPSARPEAAPHLRAALLMAAPDRRLARLAALNVRILRGRARFVDPHTVAVADQTVRARRFILAVGAACPTRADLLLEGLLGQTDVPDRLVFDARDLRDVALAQALRRLGWGVALETSGEVLPDLDPELVAPLARALVHEGVEKREVATGLNSPQLAAPRLEALALDRADVQVVDRRLVLSPALRTSNPRVYAVGAIAGARSSQAAQAQITTVLKSAFFRLPVRYQPSRVPQQVVTDPAIATVGLSEAEARALGSVGVWRWPFAETAAASVDQDPSGFIKVVTDSKGRVVGAGVVHRDAAEQIAFWSLAVASRLTLGQLGEIHLPAPALAEASRRVALQYAARRLQTPWIKRTLALLGRFG